MKNFPDIGIVILAAGASRRLGAPKQMLLFRGETLLRRAAKTALASNCRPVVVVLGALAEVLKNELSGLEVEAVKNPNWQTGMGGSLRIGLRRLNKLDSELGGVVVTVCDQPFLDADLIARIIKAFHKGDAPVVASAYNETLGVPALFRRALFPELLNSAGDAGAQRIIKRYQKNAVAVDFPAGGFDVDTMEDYLKLQSEVFRPGR